MIYRFLSFVIFPVMPGVGFSPIGYTSGSDSGSTGSGSNISDVFGEPTYITGNSASSNPGASIQVSGDGHLVNSASSSLFSDKSIEDQYLLNLALQKQAQQYSSAEAEKERQWSQMMSNSTYSRAVQDLRAAGLNPYLALSNFGASSYSGASAGSSANSVNKGSDSFSNLMKTAVSASAIVKILKAVLK